MRPKSLEKERAIKSVALRIIAEEGLENLSMQKLALEAKVSPRTIYIKYLNKEDFLVRLYIEEVLGEYEKALLQDFNEGMSFQEGIKKLWSNAFLYLSSNRYAFALIKYGKSSPLLNIAYQANNISEGQYFQPIRLFVDRHIRLETIPPMPFDVYRAMLFSPIPELVQEYFDYQSRPVQIITERLVLDCADLLINGIAL